ncbi:hypothetical protein CRYUN_Cryun17cG0068600 [Craigia yunnanensis]
MYKVNVDAAYVSKSKEACLGMVIQDFLGVVQWSAVKRIGNIQSPLHAEMKAILFRIEEASSSLFPSI